MSIYEIQTKLAELEAKKAELFAALDFQKAQAKVGLVDQIKALVADSEFHLDDILAELTPRAKAAAPRPRKAREEAPSAYPVYRLLTNPEQTYSRGVLPVWFKDAMAAAHLDPTKKEDREIFKAQHMRREAA